jgi:hypothetical protein
MIKTKIDRVILRLAETRTVPLIPADQLAVRILRSRQRLIDREWLAVFGNGKAKEDAVVELALKRTDDGTLFNFGERHHSQGRLSCKACATDVTETNPLPSPLARLCPHCKSGVQHCYDMQDITPPDVTVNVMSGDIVTMVPDPVPVTEIVVYTRHYCCDMCGVEETWVL